MMSPVRCPFGYLKLAGSLVGNTLAANDSAAACPSDPSHRILILGLISTFPLIKQSALFFDRLVVMD